MTEKGNKKAGTKAIEPLLEVIDCKKGSRVLPKKMKQVSCCPCRCDKHRLAFYHVLFLVEWLALLHLHTSSTAATGPPTRCELPVLLLAESLPDRLRVQSGMQGQ